MMNHSSFHKASSPSRLAILLIMACYLLLAGSFSWADVNPKEPPKIADLTINGIIGPATEDYIERALLKASEIEAELIILRMDTPGGLSRSMRGIVKNIANSPIPVASYVTPTGARAASAGTYILYASHIAAMAPGTNLGAATPIQLGGISSPEPPDSDKNPSKPSNQEVDAKTKMVNDAVAYIQGLAELHGRNADWAEKAVREGASLPATQALELNVIDLIASNTEELLEKIDGRSVIVLENPQSLNTLGASIIPITPDWRSRLLSVITNPNIAYILMLIGIYGLILEFYNPGAVLPGTVGAISLLLALYAFQLLPINYAGMALIVLGVSLMIAEAFEPSFGMLGIGGTAAFVIGSIILIDTDLPGFGIDLSIIITFAVISILVFIGIINLALKSQDRPVVSGIEELLGAQAVVENDFDHQGIVTVHSEHWQAVSETPLKKGQAVEITAVKGLTLFVQPITANHKETES